MSETKKTARKTADEAIKGSEKLAGNFANQTREALDTMNSKAKEAWDTVKTRMASLRERSDDALGAMKSSFETAGAGVRDVNMTVIELMAADARFYFDTFKKVAAAKSLKEAMEIQGDYVRTQFETSVKNLKTVGEAAQGAVTSAFKPLREKAAA